jgi:hypothetical protein
MNDTRLYVTLGATPIAALAAMDRLEQVLTRWNWGSAGSRAGARLVIKELIEDAVEHAGPAPEVALELARAGHRLRIEVTDTTPGHPHSRFVEAAGHHELHVVQSLASQWGTSIHPHGGTTVWCELISIPEPRRPGPTETLDIAA